MRIVMAAPESKEGVAWVGPAINKTDSERDRKRYREQCNRAAKFSLWKKRFSVNKKNSTLFAVRRSPGLRGVLRFFKTLSRKPGKALKIRDRRAASEGCIGG
jgi:hypothetical protein